MSHKSTLSQDPVNKACQQKRSGNINLLYFLKFWIQFHHFIASLGISSKNQTGLLCHVSSLENLQVEKKSESTVTCSASSWLQDKWIKTTLYLLSNCSNYPQWILHIQKYTYDASLAQHDE